MEPAASIFTVPQDEGSVFLLNINIFIPEYTVSYQKTEILNMNFVRPEVLVAMNMNISVFWDVTPCSLV
jgi:hypothetical protein